MLQFPATDSYLWENTPPLSFGKPGQSPATFWKIIGIVGEKAVDVKLASDLIALKDIYDTAVIVSGDQDYVLAVQVIKDYGKRVVTVAFERRDGRLLPGGARQLNQASDWGLPVKHSDLDSFLKILPQTGED